MNWYLKCLKQYADFNGRARRKEYWMFVLFNSLIGFAIGIVDGITGISEGASVGYLGIIYNLAMLIPNIAVGVRRMHDVGKSGWFILFPIYNLILALTGGDNGSNKYGPDPKSEGHSSVDSSVLDSNY